MRHNLSHCSLILEASKHRKSHMSATLKHPKLKAYKPAPDFEGDPLDVYYIDATASIEIDSDTIEGPYAEGAWEALIAPFTAKWVAKKPFSKRATVWVWGSPSVNFGHPGYSYFIAECGFPSHYFSDLQSHLARKLGKKSRFSDYVQPNPSRGWRARVHVQDGTVWQPLDEEIWTAVAV